MKKSKLTSRLRNNQGQALIEYVLLLIITVSLLLAMMNAIFKPFGAFVENYMGKYVQCLLEYGELPSFGSQNPSVVDQDSECDKKFKAATLTGGRPPANNGSSNSSDDSGNKNKTDGSTSSSDSDSSGGNSGTYAGSASRGGGRFINRRPSTGVEAGTGKSEKVVEIALEGGGANGFFRSSSGGMYVRPPQKRMAVAISGLTEAEKKKLEKKAEGNAKIIATGDDLAPAPKKIPVKKPEPKITVEEEDKPFTIGNFIRYLFIAALIIALVIFIGGQALQMSKNFEK